MDRIRNRARPSLRTAVAALAIAAAATHAGETPDRDCDPTPVHVEVDDQSLTRAEKIARLDEALRESLARFDECQNADPDRSTATEGDTRAKGVHGGAADGGASEDSVPAESGGDDETEEPVTTGDAVDSVAAPDIEGTEAPEEAEGTDAELPPNPDGGHPGIPDDIPGPDNDSVLEAQIRRAAMEETDPEVRAELWNEYRKYKGLPTRPLPDGDGDRSNARNSE